MEDDTLHLFAEMDEVNDIMMEGTSSSGTCHALFTIAIPTWNSLQRQSDSVTRKKGMYGRMSSIYVLL